MIKEKYYTASAELTRRAGTIDSRYRTKDGRYVITDRDLGKISLVMTPQEFIGGIDIIEVSEKEAKRLVSEGGYHLGELYEENEGNQEDAGSSSSEELNNETTEEE